MCVGVFSGLYAIHPFTGSGVPVYVADYVLSDYGTKAVMGQSLPTCWCVSDMSSTFLWGQKIVYSLCTLV